MADRPIPYSLLTQRAGCRSSRQVLLSESHPKSIHRVETQQIGLIFPPGDYLADFRPSFWCWRFR